MRRVPLHKSGMQYNLFLGCDRELIMLAGLIAFVLVFSMHTFSSIIFGIILWTSCLYLLRKLGQYDPLARHIYRRHVFYKKYYPAHSTPYAPSTRKYPTQPYKKKRV